MRFTHRSSHHGRAGCYLVSDGGPKPQRMHIRAPSFVNLQTLPHMIHGGLWPMRLQLFPPSIRSWERLTDELFSDENTRLAEEIIKRYPKARSAMIPLLHLAQEQEGWVTEAAMAEIAELVGTSSAEVLGTCLFYEMFKREPVGKYSSIFARPCRVLGWVRRISCNTRKLCRREIWWDYRRWNVHSRRSRMPGCLYRSTMSSS